MKHISLGMKYFTLEELSRSATASARGIDNTPSIAAKLHLIDLVENILDPLREAYGKPIGVNSGYRSQALNKAVGGAATSDHLTGRAADIHGTPNTKAENQKLFELIKSLDLPYRQLIDEKNFSWVHVSYNPEVKEHRAFRL